MDSPSPFHLPPPPLYSVTKEYILATIFYYQFGFLCLLKHLNTILHREKNLANQLNLVSVFHTNMISVRNCNV